LHGFICGNYNCILFIFAQAESTKQATRQKVPDASEESNDQVASTSDAKVCADIKLGVFAVCSEALYLNKLLTFSSDYATPITQNC
jgi:hypothetical protein